MGHENSTPGLGGNHSHRRFSANYRKQDDSVFLANIRQRKQQMESERRVINDVIELNNFRYGRASGRNHNSIAYDFVLPHNQIRSRSRNSSIASNRIFGQDNARNGSFNNDQANRTELSSETQRETERSSLLSQTEPVLKLVNLIGEKLERFEWDSDQYYLSNLYNMTLIFARKNYIIVFEFGMPYSRRFMLRDLGSVVSVVTVYEI
jgi:hypothetical protein